MSKVSGVPKVSIMPEASEVRIRKEVKLPAHRAGLPGNVDMIRGSAFLPAYKAGHPADLPVS